MKNVTRIIFLALCGALALSSCNKKVHTPDPQDQKTPIGFSAVSETSTVKSATEATPSLSEFHEDFGVWGIARHSSSTIQPYVLWGEDELSEVYAEENEESVSDEDKYTGVFIPREDAYWLVGYTYNFLAIAPYDSGATDLEIDQDNNQMSFTYDLTSKYANEDNPTYTFDLLAAAAETEEVTSSRTTSQELTFWHLFTKVCVNVRFVDASGTVTGMRLANVDTRAQYTISHNTGSTINVATVIPTGVTELTLPFESADFENITDNGVVWQQATIHILPQDISNLEMYLDFDITADGQTVSTTNFKVNLAAALSAPDYGDNEWYNWNIVISPKGITFDVSVNPWADAESGYDDSFDLQ